MTSKFVSFFKPFSSIVPSIRPPIQELTIKTKVLWSLGIFIIYSVLLSTPLIGVNAEGGDPFAFMRTITASTSGSMIQLGIGPLLVAGILVQFLLVFNVININMDDPTERASYNCAIKVFALFFTLIGAIFLLIS